MDEESNNSQDENARIDTLSNLSSELDSLQLSLAPMAFITPRKARSDICAVCLSPLMKAQKSMSEESDDRITKVAISMTRCNVSAYIKMSFLLLNMTSFLHRCSLCSIASTPFVWKLPNFISVNVRCAGLFYRLCYLHPAWKLPH
jgi:hypothetical protein